MGRVRDGLKALYIGTVLPLALLIVFCAAVYAQEQPGEQPKQPQKPPVEKPKGDQQKKPEKDSRKPADDKEEKDDQRKVEEDSKTEEKKEDKKEEKKEEKKEGEEKEEKGEKKEEKPPEFTEEQIKKAYPVGERLTYNISWKGIHAGTSVLEVNAKVRYKGRQCFRIRSYANSAKAISLVYKVEDRLQTYVDAETLEPLRSDQKMREGSRRREQYVIYSPKDRTAEYFKKKKGKFESRYKHTKVPYGIQGSLSSLYFLRTMKLELGKSYEVKVLTGRRISKGVFEVTKKKEMKISGVGTFTALRITPKYIEMPGHGKMKPGEGLFVASGDSEVWLDEETGMPLLMIVDIPLGSIRVQLCKKEMIVKKKKKKK
jgi:hypothetical protein